MSLASCSKAKFWWKYDPFLARTSLSWEKELMHYSPNATREEQKNQQHMAKCHHTSYIVNIYSKKKRLACRFLSSSSELIISNKTSYRQPGTEQPIILLILVVTQQAIFWRRLGKENWFLSSQSPYFTNTNWIAKFHEAISVMLRDPQSNIKFKKQFFSE